MAEFQGQHAELTEQIIATFYQVANELGYGFLESVYRRSMLIALRQAGMKAEEEVSTPVYFRGILVGTFYADLLVEDRVILELKTAEAITPAFEAQLLHYLRSSPIEIGFVLCFGTQARFKRIVMANDRKKNRNAEKTDKPDKRR